MITEVHEAIKVGAIFGDNKKKTQTRLVYLERHKIYYPGNYLHLEGKGWKNGDTLLYGYLRCQFFSISYNTYTLLWTLHSIYT